MKDCFKSDVAIIEWFYSMPIVDRAFAAALLATIVFALWRSWISLTHGRNIGYYRGYQSSPLYNLFLWLVVLPLMLPKIPGMLRSRREEQERKDTAPFIGNAKTNVVHKRGCEYEQRMSRIDDCRVPFDFIEQAVGSGYRRCNFCFGDEPPPRRPHGSYLLVRTN